MASLNLNKVILAGHLTATPELRQTPNGVSVASFSIAVNRRMGKGADGQTQNAVDFFNIVAWRNQAEFITRYFKKGSAICVTGSLQTRSWTDQQGNKRNATDIVVDEAFFVDNSSANSATMGGDAFGQVPAFATPAAPAPAATTTTAPVSFDSESGDEDLPF